jgi:release factor glutamine methyltransferase
MLSFGSAFHELKGKLQPLYDEREATAIAHELMQHVTGLDKTKRLTEKETLFDDAQQQEYEQAVKDLMNGKPLQYVTCSAWFLGKEYFVNKHVLIPRPETEELVQWIVDSWQEAIGSRQSAVGSEQSISNSKFQILDIGAGSGCIPIALKLAMPEAAVTSCDISNEALAVARENAKRLNVDVELVQMDFLDAEQRNKMGMYDVIVSNPPYIPAAEKERLHKNVAAFEPGLALFVPDDDALVFYKAIALFGKTHLKENGFIYCELDAAHAEECKTLFEAEGYNNVELKKDMHGNWRMVRVASPVLSEGEVMLRKSI